MDKLAEAAVLAIRGLLLIKKRQLASVEFPEPFVPADLADRVIAGTGELETNGAGLAIVTAGNLDRLRAALLPPATNCVMIGCNPRRSARCHQARLLRPQSASSSFG